jgi:ADP-dependent phosphofructokinase/glucokinase
MLKKKSNVVAQSPTRQANLNISGKVMPPKNMTRQVHIVQAKESIKKQHQNCLHRLFAIYEKETGHFKE